MHKLESILENKMYKILGNFEIQMDHQIAIRRPDLVIVKEKGNLANSGLYHSGRSQSKKSKETKIETSN